MTSEPLKDVQCGGWVGILTRSTIQGEGSKGELVPWDVVCYSHSPQVVVPLRLAEQAAGAGQVHPTLGSCGRTRTWAAPATAQSTALHSHRNASPPVYMNNCWRLLITHDGQKQVPLLPTSDAKDRQQHSTSNEPSGHLSGLHHRAEG